MQPEASPGPAALSARIDSVDVIRGFALLGILLMNIIGFGLPAAYMDPTNAGGATGANLTYWLTNQVLFEGKMRAIFSMLFGAGIILFTSRFEEKGAGLRGGDLFLRRTLWLAVFGLLHAYFVWDGDILFHYGLCGLVLYAFRNVSGKRLLLAGLCVLALMAPKQQWDAYDIRTLRAKAAAADAAQKSGSALTSQQKADQEAWKAKLKEFKPPKEDIDKQIADFRGSYWTVVQRRIKDVPGWHAMFFYRWGFFDVTGMMLIGMGLFKLGVFSAQLPARTYALMLLAGYGIGIPVNYRIGLNNITAAFDPVQLTASWSFYDLGRLSVAMGHIALVMLISKAGIRLVTKPLAAVGQMALTNYLLTSIVCSTYFYGYGFGMYARLERFQLLPVVFSMWAVNIALSLIWLRYFRFGPFEWLWRSLTRWERQPMRIREAAAMTAAA